MEILMNTLLEESDILEQVMQISLKHGHGNLKRHPAVVSIRKQELNEVKRSLSGDLD